MSCSGSADVGRNRLHATRLKFVSQHPDLGFVASSKEKMRCQRECDSRFQGGKGNKLLLDLDLRLFQLIDLLTDHLHLLELTGHCMICQLDNISANVGIHGAVIIGKDELAAGCMKGLDRGGELKAQMA